MNARRKRDGRRNRPRQAARRITLRRVPGADAWELVPPPSVTRRRVDLDEVQAMLEAGETDAAVDELRWLLAGCRQLLEAHKLLGEIALADGDLALARAHFGYAYGMGRDALGQASRFTGRLPYALPANQPFFEAGKGLAYALRQQGDAQAADQIVRQLLKLDPSDPLRLRQSPPPARD
jgi:Flp pilus assembly protein TadD